MTFKGIDDIEREKQEKAKQEFTQNTTEVMDKIITNLEDTFKRRKIEKEAKKPFWRKVLDFALGLFLFLLMIDLLLGCVWLLKYFIKSLFI